MGLDCSEESWNISENENSISGLTNLDNFDMMKFLGLIGVRLENVEYLEPDDFDWENAKFGGYDFEN